MSVLSVVFMLSFLFCGRAAVADESAFENLDAVRPQNIEVVNARLAESLPIRAPALLRGVHPRPIGIVWVVGLCGANNLELVRVVFVEEGDGDAHDAVVVAGNFFVGAHFDGVVVVVPVVSRLSSGCC